MQPASGGLHLATVQRNMLTLQKSDKLELLIKGCQKGQGKAQRALYELYHKRMFALCKRYLADAFEAEDAMINGFVKVFEHIGRYEAAGSFEGWMKRIMVNESLCMIRKKRMMHVEIEEAEIAGTFASETVLEALATEDLMRLVESLPVGYRTIFNLYAIEGYTHQEIAGLLGISEGTSKSQLSRARWILQQQLNGLLDKKTKVYYE
jgi:RNA polymerase sigma-70 factor (ECF subfamily)